VWYAVVPIPICCLQTAPATMAETLICRINRFRIQWTQKQKYCQLCITWFIATARYSRVSPIHPVFITIGGFDIAVADYKTDRPYAAQQMAIAILIQVIGFQPQHPGLHHHTIHHSLVNPAITDVQVLLEKRSF